MQNQLEFSGTWILASWTEFKNGVPSGYPMGADALGQIIYSDDGHMCAFLMRADFPKGTAGATAETCLSYGGTWDYSAGQITHQVAFSSLPHWIGRPLLRYVERAGKDMILRTKPEFSKSGNRYEHQLLWRRARFGR